MSDAATRLLEVSAELAALPLPFSQRTHLIEQVTSAHMALQAAERELAALREATEWVGRLEEALRAARWFISETRRYAADRGAEGTVERAEDMLAVIDAALVGIEPRQQDEADSGDDGFPVVVVPGCPFCEYGGPSPIKHSWHQGAVIAFEPLNPVIAGHLLVVPRRHVKHLGEDPTLSALVMGCAAELVRTEMLPTAHSHFRRDLGVNVIASAGASATQTVEHLHVHIVPRRDGDGLLLPWSAAGGGDA